MSVASADYLQMVADKGRFGDTVLGHLTPGEMVIPKPVLQNNPELVKAIAKAIANAGANPAQYVVGSHSNSTNPSTGQGEYGFSLKSITKPFTKAVSSVAKAATNIVSKGLQAVGVDAKTANQLAQVAVAVGAAYLGGTYMPGLTGGAVTATQGAAIGAGLNGYGQTGSVSAGITAGVMTYGMSTLASSGAEAGSNLSNAPTTTPSADQQAVWADWNAAEGANPTGLVTEPGAATFTGDRVADRLANYGIENPGTIQGSMATGASDALKYVDAGSTYLNQSAIDPQVLANGNIVPGMSYAGAAGAAYGAGAVGNEIGKAQNAYADYMKEQEDMAKKAREFAQMDFQNTGAVGTAASLPAIESIANYYSGYAPAGVSYNSGSGSSTGTSKPEGVKYLQATNTGNGVKYAETNAPSEEENRKNQWNNVVYV